MLTSYVFGTFLGLLTFGELGACLSRHKLLLLSSLMLPRLPQAELT